MGQLGLEQQVRRSPSPQPALTLFAPQTGLLQGPYAGSIPALVSPAPAQGPLVPGRDSLGQPGQGEEAFKAL